MRRSVSKNQVAKSQIEGDENTLVAIRYGKDLVIAGILRPFRNRRYIMACAAQSGSQRRRDATIDEEPHSFTTAGSTPSPPTTRAAYKRHAAMSSGSSQAYVAMSFSGVAPSASIASI